MDLNAEIAATVDYLGSAAAMDCLAASPYWPKWHSPWWHMLLLHEMGETHLIPAPTIRAFIAAMNATPIKIFPIHPSEFPDGGDPYRDTACHCQLGNVYRVLDAWGIDVEAELPWVKPWFTTYQMADGGLNCDDSAYLVHDECPSSMVGTIAAFEALTLKSHAPLRDDERRFLDRAADFMIGRQLIAGSTSQHNAAERDAAPHWRLPCFPRFYHYDVIRGLTALTLWAERTGQKLPAAAIAPAVDHINQAFPDGTIRLGRRCCEGHGTILRLPDGSWDHQRHQAESFPLLDAVSAVGTTSPFLSREWAATQRRLMDLIL